MTINQGRLNAEVLNALGSKGEYIRFAEIFDTVRQVSDLVDVTGPEVHEALAGMMKDSGIWTELEPGRGWRKVVAPDPEPVAGLETDQMGQTHFENAALDIFRAILNTEVGGSALVRLASDLDAMIRTASFPRLTATVTPDPEGEPDEFGNPAMIVTVSCPVCGDADVSAWNIYAVDSATRWTAADDFEVAFDSAPGQPVGFINVRYGSSTDFDGVGYYLHASARSDYKAHPVSLPEGWAEVAL